MTDVHPPLIAVAGRIGAPGKVARTPVVFSGRRYMEALLRAGGSPVLVPPRHLDDDGAAALLRRFDGLVLLGGPDVDPGAYGQEPHPTVYGVNPESDQFEMSLVRAALALGTPTLAICRGLQVANVALGGTLHQHLGDHGLLTTHAPPGFPSPPEGIVHEIVVEPGSKLAKAIGSDITHGASYHHQALDAVADALTVSARSHDGTVEAAEAETGWFVGVQWHPEDTADRDPQQQRLFDALVERAAAR